MYYLIVPVLVGLFASFHASGVNAAGYDVIKTKETGNYIMVEMAKRVAPKPVVPLVMNGVRYEAPFTGQAGIIEAYDVTTGKLLWTLPVYKIDFDNDMEKDVQEVYITAIAQNADKNSLLVTDERRRVWVVDLATRAVTPGTSEQVLVEMPSVDRNAPEPVAPVDYQGVRYEVDTDEGDGVVRATEISTYKPLWMVTVYPTAYDPNLEKDVQDVYITSMAIDKAKGRLLVSDERNRAWAVDLKSQKVTLLTEDK